MTQSSGVRGRAAARVAPSHYRARPRDHSTDASPAAGADTESPLVTTPLAALELFRRRVLPTRAAAPSPTRGPLRLYYLVARPRSPDYSYWLLRAPPRAPTTTPRAYRHATLARLAHAMRHTARADVAPRASCYASTTANAHRRARRATPRRAHYATTPATPRHAAHATPRPAPRRVRNHRLGASVATACAARRPSQTVWSGTTTTSRTGRSGSTSRCCC